MKLNILGQTYKVKICKLEPEHDGLVEYEKKQIRISKSTKDKNGVLLHEAMHAIIWEAGLHHVLLGDNKEEALVVALENGLMRAGLFEGKFHAK